MTARLPTPEWSLVSALLAAGLLVACGNKIGDSCDLSTDCSSDGDRDCDTASPGGYCTIEGCDYDTCPGEAVCVRFFPNAQLTASCASDLDCTRDELCAIGNVCAPRAAERRFCMLECSDASDCRDDYECRGAERMAAHGGEPVPDPTGEVAPSSTPQAFCAAAKPCASDADCDFGDSCDEGAGYCRQ